MGANYPRLRFKALQKIMLTRFFKRFIAPIQIKDKRWQEHAQKFTNFSSYREIKERCKETYVLAKNKFKDENPETRGKLLSYYQSIDYYIPGLLIWHSRIEQRIFNKMLISQCSGKVLDFGGGIGNFSMMAHKKGCDVTYMDVKSKTQEFAEFVFKKENADIKVLTSPYDIDKLEKYDTILFLDVIEHLSDKDQKDILVKLMDCLNPGGNLIITNYMCKGDDPNMPMDRKVCFDVRAYLINNGFEIAEWWLFRKKRPAQDKK